MPAPAAPRPGTTSTWARPSAGGSAPHLPVPARPGSASAPARARPDRQNPHGAACRRGTNPDHAATRDHAPNPPPPAPSPGSRPGTLRRQNHAAARITARSGPARAPASLVSGRKGGGHMTAHDSAGPHASLVPPQLVLLLRYPPGPPSPRPSAGPGLGRRGAAGAGGRRPCSRSDGDGEPLQARPPEAGRSPAQRSSTTARAADQHGRPGTSYPPRPARPARRTPGR
jgi:translation initiation factor IF-2